MLLAGFSPDIGVTCFPIEGKPEISRNIGSVKYGTESLSYLGPKMWSVLPDDLKNIKSLNAVKIKIKQWKPNCPCKLCKLYVPCTLKVHRGFHFIHDGFYIFIYAVFILYLIFTWF